MPSDPLVLGFDTSAAHCAAALLRGADIVATRVEEMGRGQAERLMPLLEEVLAEGGVYWHELTAIGVGVGPGNFTGIRISVSAARGLALGLNIPAVGVSSFEATSLEHPEPHIAAVAAPRGQHYLREPGQDTPRLTAEPLSTTLPVHWPPAAGRLAENIARIALARASGTTTRPAPLYIKPADAAPPRDPAPVILDS